MNMSRASAGVSFVGAVLSAAALAFAAPPKSEVQAVVDEYHGVKVTDPYRWLENWDDPKVQSWSEAQNAFAREHLDRISCADPLRARVSEVESSVGVEYHDVKYAAGRFFAMKNQPPRQQAMLVSFASVDKPEFDQRVIVDPNALDKAGSTAIDWFFPSPDARYIAVSMSEGGSESGDVHIFDLDSGKELTADRINRVQGGTAGGWLAWTPDSKSFFYTRYPRDGERAKDEMDFYTQLYMHTLGQDPAADAYQTGKDYPKVAEIVVEVSHNGRWVLTHVQNGDGGEFIQDVRSPDGTWHRLTKYEDRIVEAKFGHDDAIYLVSRKNAPNGKVLRLPLVEGKTPELASAKEIIPERDRASVQTDFFSRAGIYPTRSRLYVQYQVGGPNELRAFALDGAPIDANPISQPAISTIEAIEPLESNDLLCVIDSYVAPPAHYRIEAAPSGVGEMRKTALVVPDPPHMVKMQVTRVFATSKDGTQVPVNIVTKDGYTPDGKTPTVIWGYGGYGVNETPGFSRRRLLWIEQGGAFAMANIRGGGEYGEKWHLEGNLLNKQNVFDDFYAAAKLLIDKGYTNKDRLAIMGGSNGGLLMGATFTQHPDLCKAVVSSVGIYDMLRVELSPNGAFNITEFGTVKDADQFRALYAYSPYHHVQDGTAYPAILFLTGANDPRVDPMQSRKMTARLQAASPNSLTLLRTSGNTGHGAGTPLSARIEQTVDTYGFLFEQLGVKYTPVGATSSH